LGQTAEAKGKEIDATVGMALEEHEKLKERLRQN
jgi:hypothetical protein|tara:strand:+ start:334 stop:435 length:102 start_codon:yes stop_codon:yes gene_type:complete